MDNIKNDAYYVNKIITDIKFTINASKGYSFDEFNNDEILNNALCFRLIQISENTKKLTDEYRKSNKGVPWEQIDGLRNRVVHDYGNVSLYIVYNTLTNDLPILLEQLEKCDIK